jgi:hypothetical protein
VTSPSDQRGTTVTLARGNTKRCTPPTVTATVKTPGQKPEPRRQKKVSLTIFTFNLDLGQEHCPGLSFPSKKKKW